ncbi:MAG: sugar ABC transporter ATP-binding protein [Clostridiaceae bacterium]|nr:sugar ABC transporter ATP-binding protein [Clostridiaceae bacterium]
MANDFILEMSGINKAFAGTQALSEASFHVKRGETHCLVGANGAGKSTLMKILGGAYQRDSGEIKFDGDLFPEHYTTLRSREKGVAIIYQELSLVNTLSVAENIFLNQYDSRFVQWDKMQQEAKKLCDRFNIDIDVTVPVSQLSIGQKQLVEISKALSIGAKLIVMDEPSATLSEEEFEILIGIIDELKRQHITIVYISHRLDELFQIGDSITVLRDGRTVHSGPLSELTIDSLVRHMIGRSVETEQLIHTDIDETDSMIVFENAKSEKVGPINFDIKRGEVFGIYGLVGSGRTEVLRMLYGVDHMLEGRIVYQGEEYHPKSPGQAIKHGMGLVPEDRRKQGIVGIHPVWENATLASLDKMKKGAFLDLKFMKEEVEKYVESISIKTPSVNTIISNLSGGNQQKVVLAKWLIQDCELLLVDEPTQGIDVGAKDQIYHIINDMVGMGKTVIIVSSELDELRRICNRIAVMYEFEQVHIFDNMTATKDDIQHAALTGGVYND